ncbi:MAG: DUF1287 domain-containing protein [Pseudomonadota bacterium]
MEIRRRTLVQSLLALPLAPHMAAEAGMRGRRLVTAARSQIGVTRLYDPAYVALDYPGGDVPPDRGVCIDVVIRAYRDAFSFDFQTHVHEDMAAHFSAYPKIWGLHRPDRNIDHRRVPNVETWLVRRGHELSPDHWVPGDLITCRLVGNLPHIGIVSHRRGADGPLMAIHNIGAGTQETPLIGYGRDERRFRFLPG